MVTQTDQLDAVFQALSSDVRRGILSKLAQGDQSVTALREPLDMSLAAVSKHVKVLHEAGLVRRYVRGRHHLCQLRPAGLSMVDTWVSTYRAHWEQALDRLAELAPSDSVELQVEDKP